MGYINADTALDIGQWQEYYEREITATCRRCNKTATATPEAFEQADWILRTPGVDARPVCNDCYLSGVKSR